MFVQFLVIDCRNEVRVVIEKMDFLLVTHRDVRMTAQKIMQRRCPGFLRASENEIEPLNFAMPGSNHLGNVHGEGCRGSCQLPDNCVCRTLQLSRFFVPFMIRACTSGFACSFAVQFCSSS